MDEPSVYYVYARLTLLYTLLLVSTHVASHLYLRYQLGRGGDGELDGVPFALCALAQSVACLQLLVMMLRSLDADATAAAGGSAAEDALHVAATACLYAVTPFAYLYHEAVGVGYFWGAAGIAGRGAEAAALLGLVAILTQGFASVLADLLSDSADAVADAAASDSGGLAAGLLWFWPSPASPAHALLRSALAYAGLALLLVAVPRGMLLPLRAPSAGAGAFHAPHAAAPFTLLRRGSPSASSASPPSATAAPAGSPNGSGGAAAARVAANGGGASARRAALNGSSHTGLEPARRGHRRRNSDPRADDDGDVSAEEEEEEALAGNGGGGHSHGLHERRTFSWPNRRGANAPAAAEKPASAARHRPPYVATPEDLYGILAANSNGGGGVAPGAASAAGRVSPPPPAARTAGPTPRHGGGGMMTRAAARPPVRCRQPLPTRRARTLASLRAAPALALRLAAASLWLWMLFAAASQLLAHTAELIRGAPPPPPPPPAAAYYYHYLGSAPTSWLSSGLGWLWAGAPVADGLSSDLDAASAATPASYGATAVPPHGTAEAQQTSWLMLAFIVATAVGHHLACRYQLRDTRAPRATSLQAALLQTAALQLQVAAIPVGAHALGLLPRAAAEAASTMLPLCSPLRASAFCAVFLVANVVGAALWLR